MKASEARQLTKDALVIIKSDEEILDIVYEEIKKACKAGEFSTKIIIKDKLPDWDRRTKIRYILTEQGYNVIPCADIDFIIEWKGPEQ